MKPLARIGIFSALALHASMACADPVINPAAMLNLQNQGATVVTNGNNIAITSPGNIDLKNITINTPGDLTIRAGNAQPPIVTAPSMPGPVLNMHSSAPMVIAGPSMPVPLPAKTVPAEMIAHQIAAINPGEQKMPAIPASALPPAVQLANLAPSAGGQAIHDVDDSIAYANQQLRELGLGGY